MCSLYTTQVISSLKPVNFNYFLSVKNMLKGKLKNGLGKFFGREMSNWPFSMSLLNYNPTIFNFVHVEDITWPCGDTKFLFLC